MPLAEVAALFSGSRKSDQPKLVCELHDTMEDFSKLVELAQWCEPFSPHVGLEPLDHPYSIRVPGGQYQPINVADSLILDITRLSHLFGNERQLIQQIQQQLQQLGYVARVGVGHSIAAAWLAAHWFELPEVEQATHNDLQQLIYDESADELPLEAMRLPADVLERFADLGIREIGQLRQLPRDCLPARFGEQVALRLDQLDGLVDEVLQAQQPLPDFHVDWTLEPATDRADVVEQVLHELTVRLTDLLRKHDLGALELQCNLKGEGGPWSLQVGLFQPSASTEHIWDLLWLQCEQLVLPAPANGMELFASQIAPLERQQGQLFQGRSSSDWSVTLAQLVNRLSSRLGNTRVIRPRLQQDAQPEQAWYPLPWNGKKVRNRPRAKPPANAAWRPLYLHQEPVPLRATSQPKPFHPPTKFLDRGHYYQVAKSWGPERVETGWWRGHSIRRDYYRIETTTGNRFWIYQQLGNREWFLHGEYV